MFEAKPNKAVSVFHLLDVSPSIAQEASVHSGICAREERHLVVDLPQHEVGSDFCHIKAK